MTPDLKRLCEAVSKVEIDAEPDWLREDDAEKVVRAVLMELRDMDRPTRLAIAARTDNGGPEDRMSAVHVGDVLAAVVSHILAEPATA